MSSAHRPLAGCTINISISESDDSSKRGFPEWQVNRVTLQVAAALFGQGCSVIFGHDWREDGVMEAVYSFARQMQPSVPLSPDTAAFEQQPEMRNLLPWPDNPYLSKHDLERLSSTLRVEPAGLPEELRDHDDWARGAPENAPLYQYVRARGLTLLRHRLTDESDARLCIGGRSSSSAGRYPGVIEEALLSLEAKKPLFLAGCLGGAAAELVEALDGNSMLPQFCLPTTLVAAYEAPPVRELSARTAHDRIVDRTSVWENFRQIGGRGLAAANGLTPDENSELLHTTVIDRMIELVLIGLSRLRARQAPHN